MSVTKLPDYEPSDARFVGVDAPAPMTDEKLGRCTAPTTTTDEDTVRVFAVAHQHGVVQDDHRQREREAMSVLYLTRDGERACERWYQGVGPDDFEAIDRSFCAAVDELEPAGENARRFAPIVQTHPEINQ